MVCVFVFVYVTFIECALGNLITEYFDFDDPCVNGENDQGDTEGMITAWQFLNGVTYVERVRESETGNPSAVERLIVSIILYTNILRRGMYYHLIEPNFRFFLI